MLAVGVLLIVLEPTIWHGFAGVAAPSHTLITELRQRPTRLALVQLSRYSLQDIPVPDGQLAVVAARRLLRGADYLEGTSGAAYALPFTPSSRAADEAIRHHGVTTSARPYELPFSERDLTRSDGIGQLPYASLYLADVMLAAHRSSGEQQFLDTARDMIIAFARFERSRWRRIGYLWNDHAMAARAGVLGRFWLAYRNSPGFDINVAAELIAYAERSAALLASGRDFNARTNHGVMHSLGLLQLHLAFPGLKDERRHLDVATERLEAQMSFLFAPDGFTVEHSAHYLELGLQLLDMAGQLYLLAGREPPPPWASLLPAAERRLAELTRPDGSLPAIGDTDAALMPAGALSKYPQVDGTTAGTSLYPLSGYAIWSEAPPGSAHTTMNWSHFPGRGHKHADEGSINVWAHGRGWITATGYWDYGTSGRTEVEGWAGSNAPHWLDESTYAQRSTSVAAVGDAPGVHFIEVRRRNADGRQIKRELLSLGDRLWLVIDSANAQPADSMETIWTFYPDMRVQADGGQTYTVHDARDALFKLQFSATTDTLMIHLQKGDHLPFAGWVAIGRQAIPAPALRVLAASGSSVATAVSPTGSTASELHFLRRGEDSWSARAGGWELRREGMRLQLTEAGSQRTLSLHVPAEPAAERRQLDSSFEQTVVRYPREPDLDSYRDRVALMLLLALSIQELGFALVRRVWPGTTQLRIGVANGIVVLAWMLGGLWLEFRYFQVN